MDAGEMIKSLDKAMEIMDRFEKLDMSTFELADQIKIMRAVTAYASVLRPIVEKYEQKQRRKCIFYGTLEDLLGD